MYFCLHHLNAIDVCGSQFQELGNQSHIRSLLTLFSIDQEEPLDNNLDTRNRRFWHLEQNMNKSMLLLIRLDVNIITTQPFALRTSSGVQMSTKMQVFSCFCTWNLYSLCRNIKLILTSSLGSKGICHIYLGYTMAGSGGEEFWGCNPPNIQGHTHTRMVWVRERERERERERARPDLGGEFWNCNPPPPPNIQGHTHMRMVCLNKLSLIYYSTSTAIP